MGRKDVNGGRLAKLGLGLAAALTFAVAGCGGDSGGGGEHRASEAAKDAATELRDAVAKLATTSSKLSLTAGPVSGTGTMDPPNKQGSIKMGMDAEGLTFNIEALMIENDVWLKLAGLPGVPKQWMHVDASKLPAHTSLGIKPGEFDFVGGAHLLAGIVEAEETGDGQYRGTLDLTKASGSPFADEGTVSSLGDRAKAVPFEASVDGEGRLTNLKMDLGEVEGERLKLDATYSDFGGKVDLTAPAPGEFVEAPEMIYQFLGA
jgi:hypothetical protein